MPGSDAGNVNSELNIISAITEFIFYKLYSIKFSGSHS